MTKIEIKDQKLLTIMEAHPSSGQFHGSALCLNDDIDIKITQEHPPHI
jgi:hypothetical protein